MTDRRHPSHSAFAIVAGAAAIALAGPLLLIAFTAPQSDDFCYGSYNRAHGLIGGALYAYANVNSRIAASLVIEAPFALGASFAAYRIVLAGLVGLWFCTAWRFARRWLSVRDAIAATLFFAACFVPWATNFRELALWLPAAATYLAPTIALTALFLILFAPFAPLGTTEERSWMGWAAAPLLAGVAAFSNEFSAPAAIAFAAASLYARRKSAETIGPPIALHPLLHAAVIAVAVAGFVLVTTAPSNEIRTVNFDETKSVWQTLFYGPLFTLEFFAYHIVMPGHLLWYGALLALTAARPAPSRQPQAAAAIAAAVVATVLLACAAGQWGIGDRLPGRAQNQLHLLAGIGLTAAILLSPPAPLAALGARLRTAAAARPRRSAAAAAALLFVNPATLPAYGAAFGGAAARFETETRARIAALEAPDRGDTPSLPLFSPAPLLVSYDLYEGPNRANCQLRYFGVKQIIGISDVIQKPALTP